MMRTQKVLLEVPLMSAVERAKLLMAAKDDLTSRNNKAGGEEGTVTEDEAKDLISAWKKAHPVVEEARVVDGGATWDYFIDVGDKTIRRKGKERKEQEKLKVIAHLKKCYAQPLRFQRKKCYSSSQISHAMIL